MMTEEEIQARREVLMNKPLAELIEHTLHLEEQVLESKQIRKRMMMIRNLVLEPEERRQRGRPKK